MLALLRNSYLHFSYHYNVVSAVEVPQIIWEPYINIFLSLVPGDSIGLSFYKFWIKMDQTPTIIPHCHNKGRCV